MISILGDRTANVDITWYHWPYNIDIMENPFYMAARIDKIVILELAATDPITHNEIVRIRGLPYICKYPNAQFTSTGNGIPISSNDTHFQYCPFSDPTSGSFSFSTVPKLAICHYWYCA